MYIQSLPIIVIEAMFCGAGVMLFDLKTFFLNIISCYVGIAQESKQKSSSPQKYKTTGRWSTLLYELNLSP